MVLIFSNTGERLTFWMYVQPFLSVAQTLKSNLQSGFMFRHSLQLGWSAHSLESDSQSGCMFSNFHHWFWSAQTHERYSQPECMFSHSHWWFWSSQTLEMNSHSGSMFSISDYNQLKHWRVTHLLNMCSSILVSSSDLSKTENSLAGFVFSHSH